jgi:hypothetical protein
MIRRTLIALAVVGVLSSLPPFVSSGEALRVRLEDEGAGSGVVVTDEAVGDDAPGSGVVAVDTVLPGILVNVTIGLSKPLVTGQLRLSSLHVAVAGAAVVRITLEDTGYTFGPDGSMALTADLAGDLTAPAGSTIAAQAYVNPDDLVPALGPDITPTGPLAAIGAIPLGSVSVFDGLAAVFGPSAFATSADIIFTKAGPYSLFQQVTVSFTDAGSVSFLLDSTVARTVPEPASAALLASGLAAFALSRRLRARRR